MKVHENEPAWSIEVSINARSIPSVSRFQTQRAEAHLDLIRRMAQTCVECIDSNDDEHELLSDFVGHAKDLIDTLTRSETPGESEAD